MIKGTIKRFTVLSAEQEISLLPFDEENLIPYIKQKHKVAEDHNRYVVRFKVEKETVCALIPKGIIDNKLIEANTEIICNSESCHLNIIGVEDWFDRAYNGMSTVNDIRFK